MGRLLGSMVFPGLGHLLSGRYLKGAVLAVLFSVTVQVLLLGMIWPESFGVSRGVFLKLAAGIWIYAVVSHWWVLRQWGAPGREVQVEQTMLTGIKALLRNDLGEAEEAFRTVLRLDDRDVEGWLYLARTCQLRGQERRAKRFYRVVRRLDRSGKWRWEVGGLSRGGIVTSP